jgi:F-type H+-transporting ATPase subunit delta
MTPRKARRAAQRLYRRCLVDGALDDARARDAARRVAASGRRGWLHILREFLRRVRLDLDRRTAVVESAVPLPGDIREGVLAGLARAYGDGLVTSFTLNPSLVGGMRIKVASDVYDGSVLARLNELEARL